MGEIPNVIARRRVPVSESRSKENRKHVARNARRRSRRPIQLPRKAEWTHTLPHAGRKKTQVQPGNHRRGRLSLSVLVELAEPYALGNGAEVA